MYIPSNSANTKDAKQPRLFLGLQGPSGSGKTTAGMTFPNVYPVDIDGSLTQFYGKDIPHAPFYNDAWVVEKFAARYVEYKSPEGDYSKVLNKRDALKKWLTTEAIQFTEEQTILWDSWTATQLCFDKFTRCEPVFNKAGEEDERAFWGRKIEYSRDMLDCLRALRCNVVVTFHELFAYDKTKAMVTDKLQPLQQGQFVAQIKMFFSDFYRQIMLEWDDKEAEARKKIGIDKSMFNNQGQGWFWQIKSGKDFDAKSRMPARPEILVPANFKSFNYVKP